METRGWKIGITTLRKQPRTIVWDRMLTADVTLITSKRESGPLVAKEAIACGCPVVAVDVGDMAEWMEVYPAEVLAFSGRSRIPILENGQEVTLPQNSTLSL